MNKSYTTSASISVLQLVDSIYVLKKKHSRQKASEIKYEQLHNTGGLD